LITFFAKKVIKIAPSKVINYTSIAKPRIMQENRHYQKNG